MAEPTALGTHLSSVLMRLAGVDDPLVREAILAVVASLETGSVAWQPDPDDPRVGALRATTLCGGPEEDGAPLAWVGGRVYLRRHYAIEARVAARLRHRLAVPPTPVDDDIAARWSDGATDNQPAAIRLALARPSTVITGGPGTGKTWVAVQLLAALLERDPTARARLLAPTGKAATRLAESVAQAVQRLGPEHAALVGRIPTVATTVHAALRSLHERIVVVDEASMMDLGITDQLLDALSPDARLVLLGDVDQLSSVDVGNVLSSWIAAAERPESPCAGSVARLEKSHRTSSTPLLQLAAAIRAGDPDQTIAVLRGGGNDAVWGDPIPADGLGVGLRALVLRHYGPLPAHTDPASALAALQCFRILTPHKSGTVTTRRINTFVAAEVSASRTPSGSGRVHAGCPLLVTENDPAAGVLNGDVGLPLTGPDGSVMVWFADPRGPRSVAPGRLPSTTEAWAMTIHKAQGSEFDEVAIVMPNADSALLDREMLYTAVTRARSRVVLLGSEEAIRKAVTTQTRRTSGLADALAAPTVET